MRESGELLKTATAAQIFLYYVRLTFAYTADVAVPNLLRAGSVGQFVILFSYSLSMTVDNVSTAAPSPLAQT